MVSVKGVLLSDAQLAALLGSQQSAWWDASALARSTPAAAAVANDPALLARKPPQIGDPVALVAHRIDELRSQQRSAQAGDEPAGSLSGLQATAAPAVVQSASVLGSKLDLLKNPALLATGAGVGGLATGLLLASAFDGGDLKPKPKKRKSSKKGKKKPKRKSAKQRRHKTSRSKSFGTEAQFKKRGGHKVFYTKTGQPYIKLKSGKARFIKRSK